MGKEQKSISVAIQRADIALDHYNELFSDFDISPYDKRLLSEDFLLELQSRYAFAKGGKFVINFTIPKAVRSKKTEVVIKRRILVYFRKRTKKFERLKHEKTRAGGIRVLLGSAFSAFLLLIPQLNDPPLITIYSVFIWYLIWSGLEQLLEPSEFKSEAKLAQKLLKAEYHFISEKDALKSIKILQSVPQKSNRGVRKSPKSS